MKDFYEIEDWQQCELLIDLIELIGSNNVSSLEKLSKKKGEAPQEIWANICKSRGIESEGSSERFSFHRIIEDLATLTRWCRLRPCLTASLVGLVPTAC